MKIEKKLIDKSIFVRIIISAIILWAFLYFFGLVIGEAFYNYSH